MPGSGDIVTGGGVAGLILALGYLVQQAIKARNDTKLVAPTLDSSALKDATTLNAAVLESLKEERRRIGSLVAQLNESNSEKDDLREQVDSLREQLWKLREQYERMITYYRNQLPAERNPNHDYFDPG